VELDSFLLQISAALKDLHGCLIFSEDKKDDTLLLCEECEIGCHMKCMDSPMGKEPETWYCWECTPRPVIGALWVPLMDLEPKEGVLCVLPRSHRFPKYERSFKDAQLPGSFFTAGKELKWHTTHFNAGDLVLLDLRVIHATSRNTTQKYRLSIDTRWYLKPHRDNWGRTPSTRFVEGLINDCLVDKALMQLSYYEEEDKATRESVEVEKKEKGKATRETEQPPEEGDGGHEEEKGKN